MMGKLTEKQINLIILGSGVLVFVIFAVLCYLDYKKIEEIGEEKEEEKSLKAKLLTKQVQIKKNKKRLYMLRANYNTLKKILPDEKEIFSFYLTMDQFGKDNNIVMEKLKKADTEDIYTKIGAELAALEGKEKRNKKDKKSDEPFLEDEYVLSFKGTFNQLGDIVNKIERYDRFFSVKAINIDALPKPNNLAQGATELNPAFRSSNIDISVVTFSFNGTSSSNEEDAEIDAILEGFEPDEDLKEEIKEKRLELERTKSSFLWRSAPRNPLNKLQVVTLATPKQEDLEEEKPKEKKEELDQEKLEKRFLELVEERNYLDLLASAGNLQELQRALESKNQNGSTYGEALQDLRLLLNDENDPEGKKRRKLNQMYEEFQKWSQQLEELAQKRKISQMLQEGQQTLNQMRQLYEEGRKKADPAILQKVIDLHNEMVPKLKEYQGLTEEYPEITELEKSAKKLFDKADTQMKIITLSQKLSLQGIIYMPKQPDASVAIINNKSVRHEDILDLGFVVDDIQATKVILRYREETVPVHLGQSPTKKVEE